MKTNKNISLVEYAENLDGFLSPDDLRGHIASVNFPREYYLYGITKALAMESRASGDISHAIDHEKECDRLFPLIPMAFRW